MQSYRTSEPCLAVTHPERRPWLGAGATAVLCSVVVFAGLMTITQLTPTLLATAPTTRPVLARPVGAMVPSQRISAIQVASRPAALQPLQATEDTAAEQVSTFSTTFSLPLVAAMSSLFGFLAATALQKRQAPATQDNEEPRRAHWAVGLAATAAITLPQALAPGDYMPAAMAGLPKADPISNPEALLRYSLPIDNKEIRNIQTELESISRQLRIPGSKPVGPISKAVSNAENIIKNDNSRKKIIADFAPDKKAAGLAAIDALVVSLSAFQEGLREFDKQNIPFYQRDALQHVGDIEAAMVKQFPFEVPAKYASLPQLKGRATVEGKIKFNDNIDIQEGTFTIVLDGYNAPITAGNFMDLVNKGFYDGMKIQRADGFVVQTGNPDGNADGYVDPDTGAIRKIPFEVRVVGDKDPYYEATLEDLGVYNAPVVLPFNAYGTMAMARGEFAPNSGSSQVFWLLKDSELTPVGNNILDGRYSAFGYITKNSDLLKEMKVGDQIVYMKVTAGQENLVPGDRNAPAVTFDDQ